MLLVGSTTIFSAVHGFRRKEPIYQAGFSAMGVLLGRFIRLGRPPPAGAGAGSALYPPPGKSPSGPLSAESGWIKPLAKEFSRAESSKIQHPSKVRGLGPCSSFRRPLRQPCRACPSLLTLSLHLSNQIHLTALLGV